MKCFRACLVLAFLFAMALPAAAEDQRSEAERLFSQAQEHFAQGDYGPAIELFAQSFVLSHEPLLVFDIAQSYRLKGDCKAALDNYRRYLNLIAPSTPANSAEETRRLALDRALDLDRQCGQLGAPLPPKEAQMASEQIQPATPPPFATVDPQEGGVLSILGFALAMAGGGALATGIYYLATDGQEQCTTNERPPCVFRRDSSRMGWSVVGGGTVLVASAVTLLLWPRQAETSISVGVGPGAIRVMGSF